MFRESGSPGMVRVWEEEKWSLSAQRVLSESAFAFVLIFTAHELCRREIGQA